VGGGTYRLRSREYLGVGYIVERDHAIIDPIGKTQKGGEKQPRSEKHRVRLRPKITVKGDNGCTHKRGENLEKK